MSKYINLSQEERDKFATWLVQQADEEDVMTDQLEKLSNSQIHEPRIKSKRALAQMYRLVAKEIMSWESMSIEK